MKIHETIEIDKYLSPEKLNIKAGGRVLLKSPTGSGKTTLALNDKTHNYSIILVPTIIIGESKSSSENVSFYHDGAVPNYHGENRWISTYDNILRVPPSILSQAIVWIDEIHLLACSSYRQTLPQIFSYIKHYAKTIVGLSGTLNHEVFEGVFEELITVEQRNKREVHINNILTSDVTTLNFAIVEILRHVNNNSKIILMIQNKAELHWLETYLRKKRAEFQHEDSIIKYVSHESELTVTNSERATKMILNGKIPQETKLIIGTSVLVEGWDLKDDNKWVAIIAGDSHLQDNLKIPEVVMQFANRIRSPMPIIAHIQRPHVSYSKAKVLSDNEIKRKITFHRTRSFELFKNKGTFDNRYIVELESKPILTDIPLLEKRQQNINNKCRYGTKAYIEHAKDLGITGVYEDEYKDPKVPIKSAVDLQSAYIGVFTEAPHPLDVTDKLVESYLNRKEGVALPESIEVLISTCRKFRINARTRISELMSLLECFEANELLRVIEQGVSISQLLEARKRFKNNAIEMHGVRKELLEKLGTKEFHNEKTIYKTINSIKPEAFNGKTNKALYLSRKTVKTLLGGFVTFETKRMTSKREHFYKLNEKYEHVFQDGTSIEFKLSWINHHIREDILKLISARRDKRTKQKLKQLYGQYVEFFDNLDAA